MNKSPSQSTLTYQPFQFLKLDNKLNKQKLEQKKKQNHDKNFLSVYQKKLPNLQLIKQCDNIMLSYKNHYNINRRFSLFVDQKDAKKQEDKNRSKQSERFPSIRLERAQSTQLLSAISRREGQKTPSLVEAEKIMKPIKTNQYVNEKGFVKLSERTTLSQLKNSSFLQMSQNLFSTSSSLRNNLHKNIFTLTKEQNTEPIQKLTIYKTEQIPLTKSISFSGRQRKKQLKIKFRKMILLIIEKMKLMKITFSQIIQQDPFDKRTPYKFGDQIFTAVKQGYEPKVFRIMMQNRLSIFSIDTTGKTTLMWACIRGYEEIVELLLSNGVETHLRDINGRTALYFGIKYNHVKCVKSLFIHSKHLESDIQSMKMSQEMRKIVRIGLSTHKLLITFKNIEKQREYFEQEYRYYFKQ